MRRKGIVAGLLASLVILTGCAGSTGGGTELVSTCNVAGSDASITPEQNANAKAIIDVALELGLGQRGAEVGVVTANVESDLVNVDYGDYSSTGQMTTSRGLFQQKQEWGPLADRLNPSKAARMFYTGGAAGQKGLMDIAGWQTMELGVAMQAVQGSQYDGGTSPGYAGKEAMGLRVVASLIGDDSAAACSPTGPGAVITNGVEVTLPNNEFVAAAVRGKTVVAPNAGMAKGIAAGLAQLGLPYVWGGSPADGGPADNGCSRGGGALNSCGSEIGFDCSGLTAFVIRAGGFPGPGTNSSAQRAAGTAIPAAQGIAGDIAGFPGHVAVFLGRIDGVPYILEASTVGVPVHVVPLTRTDADDDYRRFWSNTAA